MNSVSLTLWQKWILVSGKTALTVLISWQISVLVWQVVAPEPLILAEPTKGSGSERQAVVFNTARYHLFGEAGKEEVVKAPKVEVEAPDTRLKLTLLGVTVATPEEASSAIISSAGKGGDFFRVGDTVQGRTILAAVYKDKVILDTSGKLETLKFDEKKSTGSVVRERVDRAKPRVSGSAGNISESKSLTKRLTSVKNANEFVNVATAELESDAAGALATMGLQAIGPGEGYRVTPRSPLRKFQLRPGDIVLSVNGQSLGDPSADRPILQEIRSADSVRIEVQRGDNRFTVNHQLDTD